MAGVNTAREYTERMNYGYWDSNEKLVKVTRPLLQGGIVAVYYLPGTLVGALWGGWLGDKYGRISTIGFACLWTIVGAALQASAMNAEWMFCGRSVRGDLCSPNTDGPSSRLQRHWNRNSQCHHPCMGH